MLKAKPSLSSPEFMEEEDIGEEETPRSPFWLQTTNNVSRIHRYRHRLSSLFFNSFVLIIFLLVFAVVSMVFIIPSLINFSSHIFKPNLVKRSWDSINLILVLVALAFGFLGRNISNDEKLTFDDGYDRSEPQLSAGAPVVMSSSSLTPHQWYGFQDQPMNSVNGLRRQRTSSSYPDLRELSPPWNHGAADPWRFSDDTHLDYYRVLESTRNYTQERRRREQHSGIHDVHVDAVGGVTRENLYTPPRQVAAPEIFFDFPPLQPASPTSLPPQPPPHTVKKKTKRRARSSEPGKILSPVIDPLPEPASPPLVSPFTERKRNDGNATKEFFTSFYHKKKKKRQKERSVDNLDTLLHHSQLPEVTFQLPSPSPPPLPPPPPPLVLHNSFPSKTEKQKKILSVPQPPRRTGTAALAPPPTITQVAPFITDKPRVPLIMSSFNGIDDSSSGGESPMKQIPPPPPPPLPPFKMPDWKFAVEGDFVRLQSTLCSRSVSPDGDEAQSPSSDVDVAVTEVAQPLFCPSPDVDTKADSFIARFRAGLKLERMSKLGPGPAPKEL